MRRSPRTLSSSADNNSINGTAAGKGGIQEPPALSRYRQNESLRQLQINTVTANKNELAYLLKEKEYQDRIQKQIRHQALGYRSTVFWSWCISLHLSLTWSQKSSPARPNPAHGLHPDKGNTHALFFYGSLHCAFMFNCITFTEISLFRRRKSIGANYCAAEILILSIIIASAFRRMFFFIFSLSLC